MNLGATVAASIAHASEWRGFVGVPSFIGAATQGTTSGPLTASSGSLAAQAGDLVFATLLVNAATQRIPNSTGGFTLLQHLRRDGSNPMDVAYRVPTSSGNVAASWPFTQAQRWSSLIIAIHFTPPEPPQPGTGPRLVQQVARAEWDVAGMQVRLPRVPTPGNLLVICHESNSSNDSAVQGGGVSSWTHCVGSAPDNMNSSVWAGIVGNAPSDTITFTLASSPNGALAVITEWSGLSPTLSYRAVLNDSGPTASSVPRTASVLAAPGELVIGMVGFHQGENTISPTSGGFTELGQLYLPSTAMSACYKLPTSAGLVEAAWTLQDTTRWAAPIVVFNGPPTTPAAVQKVQQTINSGWNLSSLQVQLPTLPRPGNLLVICHESGSSSPSTVQGGGVAQWTRCASSAPTIVNAQVWAGIVGNSPTSTINLTLGSSPNGAIAAVTEWSGLSSTLSYRATMGSSDQIGSTLPRTASVAAASGELVMAMVGIHQGGNQMSGPINNFIDIGQRHEPSLGLSASYFLPSTAGTFGTGCNLLYSTRWAAPIVVFAAH